MQNKNINSLLLSIIIALNLLAIESESQQTCPQSQQQKAQLQKQYPTNFYTGFQIIQNTGKTGAGLRQIKYTDEFTKKNFIGSIKLDRIKVLASIGYVEGYKDQYWWFDLRCGVTQQGFNVVYELSNKAEWTRLFMFYFVTTMDDVVVELLLPNNKFNNQLMSRKPKGINITITRKFQSDPIKGDVKAYAFLSGIKCTQPSLQLTLHPPVYDDTKKLVSIRLTTKNQFQQISNLYINLLIYYPNKFEILITEISDSLMEELNTQRFLTDYDGFVERLTRDKLFMGFLAIDGRYMASNTTQEEPELPQGQQYGWKIMGGIFRAKMLSIKFPTLPAMLIDEKASRNECISYKQCHKMRTRSYYIISTPKPRAYCIKCPKGQQYSYKKFQCICTNRYFRNLQGQCIHQKTRCLKTERYQPGKNKNQPGVCMILVKKISDNTNTSNLSLGLQRYNQLKFPQRCYRKQFFVEQAVNYLQCKKECLKGQVYNIAMKDCSCPTKYQIKPYKGINFRQCVECSKNQLFNPQTQSCQCKPNFFNLFGRCIKCSPFSVYDMNRKTCTCQEGYIGLPNNCRRDNGRRINIEDRFDSRSRRT